MGSIHEFIGKKVIIISVEKADKQLFHLNSGRKEVSMTAQYFYDNYKGQWFEPNANNYLPLTYCASDIGQSYAYKHLTWQQVAEFAEVKRSPVSYATNPIPFLPPLPGDWKVSKQGGDGYLMVEINGKPYWADAVGQIPFAVGTFRLKLGRYGDKERAIKTTLLEAQHHPTGNMIPTWNPVISNQYDDYFVLRGALWASRKYDVTARTVTVPIEHGMSVENIIYDERVSSVIPSADLLAKHISAETAKRFGLGR